MFSLKCSRTTILNEVAVVNFLLINPCILVKNSSENSKKKKVDNSVSCLSWASGYGHLSPLQEVVFSFSGPVQGIPA